MAVLMGESPIGVEDNQKPLVQAGLEALCWVLGHDHIKTFGENLEKLGWQHVASIDGEEEYRDV